MRESERVCVSERERERASVREREWEREGRGWLEGRTEGGPVPFRTGLVFKAHRLVYHSTLGSRIIKTGA